MNGDQIAKKVDWLDDERRKDQTRLSTIEERMLALEGNQNSFTALIRDQAGEITRLRALVGRMDGYDDDLLKLRVETKQFFEEFDKQAKKREAEASQLRQAEMRNLDNSIGSMRKEVDSLAEVKRSLTARIDAENKIARGFEEFEKKIETITRSQEDYTRTMKLLEDGRRQDGKKLTDLFGELTSVRKRTDDQHGRIELLSASQKKLEARQNEFSLVENERGLTMEKFLDNQALRDVERDRTWKEWESRFISIENQAVELENQLELIETTRRDIQRTHTNVEELAQKVDRRIIELTEMQRLSDERFRQEWLTFKADDQKRWTNYTLTLDEQHGETNRQIDKLSDRLTRIEDDLQELKDEFGQMFSQTEILFQNLRSGFQEWLAIHERTIGRGG